MSTSNPVEGAELPVMVVVAAVEMAVANVIGTVNKIPNAPPAGTHKEIVLEDVPTVTEPDAIS